MRGELLSLSWREVCATLCDEQGGFIAFILIVCTFPLLLWGLKYKQDRETDKSFVKAPPPPLQLPHFMASCYSSIKTTWYVHTAGTCTLSPSQSAWEAGFPAASQLSFPVTPESRLLCHIDRAEQCIFNGLCIIEEAGGSEGLRRSALFHCWWQRSDPEENQAYASSLLTVASLLSRVLLWIQGRIFWYFECCHGLGRLTSMVLIAFAMCDGAISHIMSGTTKYSHMSNWIFHNL